MTCQHPNCSYSIHSICTNHCHWSLCEEHINEHKNSLLIEFEEVLEDLIKPTNELSKSIEHMKQNFNHDQQKELDSLKQSHQKQLNDIEEQLIEINQFQNQFNKISEHLIKIKTNEEILIQNDFQQIEILSKEIHQYQNSLTNLNKEEYIKPSINNQCPLTSFNTYGLLPSHNVRLCSPNKRLKNVFAHFRNYHHLTHHHANELIQAIRLNLDPIQTKLFPSNAQIVALDDKQPCPLQTASHESGIRCVPCTSRVTDKFLPIHLKTVHHLRLPQIKEIMESD
jgi:hypothetical protein